MSFARARVLSLHLRPIRIPLALNKPRHASSNSHSHHEDTNVYPQETFNTPFWRKTLLLSLLGVGICNIMPFIDEDGDYITRYIALYATPTHVWARINDKHLAQSLEAAQGQILIASAQRPVIHRMRNPASFGMGSPHCIAVGTQVDVSDVVVKKDKLWTE